MYNGHVVEVFIKHKLGELIEIDLSEWLETDNVTIDNNNGERYRHNESCNVKISERSVSKAELKLIGRMLHVTRVKGKLLQLWKKMKNQRKR